jgi:hypothetical protein
MNIFLDSDEIKQALIAKTSKPTHFDTIEVLCNKINAACNPRPTLEKGNLIVFEDGIMRIVVVDEQALTRVPVEVWELVESNSAKKVYQLKWKKSDGK